MQKQPIAALVPVKDDRVDRVGRPHSDVVNKVDRLPSKVKAGAALKAAIGNDPLKKYGDKGMLANVTSGEKVPDYFARIVDDKHAKRRLALALLSDDSDVIVRTVIEFPAARKESA